ncbi:hypothetical protein MPTK1_2g17940 [Marchantia polymorpha subsp. ruderalis]|uniref:Coiled-coil SMC6 And NSE5 INteracting (CANIN) domain-containing protein n=1 Tax=Marchantia polymorpha TaxID=3197 RepID=A0A2R6WGC3_MARPO|nr:hypothetical protein MARPO_0094s0062 [Marchantia polymorpha]BBN02766.1 hypothetical protein Mp_2g17940 [Marchantia polymorpha subsp. ruderalis]|eukprot:PTQ32893.1 hypothetical protein MARPO_0094s0062 [Marchantia polymorpha]
MEDDDTSWMKLDSGTPEAKFPHTTVVKKRNKLIMLDDLIREREKKKKQRSNLTLEVENDSSATDDEEDDPADKKAEIVKKMLKNLESESTAVDEIVSLLNWGEKVFFSQKPLANHITSEECLALCPDGIPSATGLLLSGLLRSLVISEGRCDEETTRWIYSQMIYSPSEHLEKAACQLLRDLLSLERPDRTPVCKLEWIPNFTEITEVFGSYGYRKATLMKESGSCSKQADANCLGVTTVDGLPTNADHVDGPPPNIRSFVAFLTSFFQTRNFYQTLSASEAEELLVTLVHCQLDRRMETISFLFKSCLKALVHYFTEEEWDHSCPRIAASFYSISSNYMNHLRAVKSLHAGDNRLCSLQRSVVIQLLGRRLNREIKSAADVVSIFKPIRTKKKDFDFLELVFQLTSADLYLWSEPEFERNVSVHADWLDFLKRCTLNIASSDERPHATKARNLASFLWQKFQFEKFQS